MSPSYNKQKYYALKNRLTHDCYVPLFLDKTKNGGIRMKYSNEFKLQCIEMYYQGKYPETPDGISPKHFHDLVREWVLKGERSSLDAVQHKSRSRIRTPEEKLELVEKVLAGNGLRAVAQAAEVDHSVLYQWVRKYKMEGYEGLINKKKSRPPKEPPLMPKKKAEPKELTESEREELIRLRAEVEYLKAETAAIKKLMALRREKEAARLKAKKQQRSGSSEKKDTD